MKYINECSGTFKSIVRSLKIYKTYKLENYFDKEKQYTFNCLNLQLLKYYRYS